MVEERLVEIIDFTPPQKLGFQPGVLHHIAHGFDRF
jgi:hypothetical protein